MEDQYKIQVLKSFGWTDLNPEIFTFNSAETAAKVAQEYNKNLNPYTYRAVKADRQIESMNQP